MVNMRTPAIRRQFLLTVALIAVIFFSLAAVSGVMYGIITRPRTPRWQALGAATSLLAAEPQRATFEAQIVFVVANADGPLVLNARDPLRGCVVAWVSAEQQFIDPCYGSHYRIDGTYLSGPSPRGLDQFAARNNNGTIEIDLNRPLLGAAHS